MSDQTSDGENPVRRGWDIERYRIHPSGDGAGHDGAPPEQAFVPPAGSRHPTNPTYATDSWVLFWTAL
ncbi:MAG: hypothetical protein AAGD47_15705, partial [Pseudomonadota bacterium]